MLTGEARVQSEYVSPDERPFVIGASDQVQEEPQEQPQKSIQISKKK
jgi:hypothetical protein